MDEGEILIISSFSHVTAIVSLTLFRISIGSCSTQPSFKQMLVVLIWWLAIGCWVLDENTYNIKNLKNNKQPKLTRFTNLAVYIN